MQSGRCALLPWLNEQSNLIPKGSSPLSAMGWDGMGKSGSESESERGEGRGERE